MKHLIKKLLREGLLSESDGAFKDITGIHDYDNLMAGKTDNIAIDYKNMDFEVENMTPEDYLIRCAKQQGTTYEQQLSYIRKDKVEELKKLIGNGVKLYMPYINNVKGEVSQEGRHRAKAAMEMGIDTIPVLVINPKSNSVSDGTLSSKIGVWADLSKDENDNFYVSYDLSGGWKFQDALLSSVNRSYDVYYLDDILSMYIYPTLYPNPLSIVKRDDFHSSIKFDVRSVVDFSDVLPDKYSDIFRLYYDAETDEDEKRVEDEISKLIVPLEKLATLYILMHNANIFSEIFSYDSKTKTGKLLIDEDLSLDNEYDSGKDMLSKMMIYDDLGFYSFEGHEYHDMDWKFIEKYIDLV
jgi:hypothetical protein